MADKKKVKSYTEERDEQLKDTMDWQGTADVGKKQYEEDKEKKKGGLRAGLAAIFLGRK